MKQVSYFEFADIICKEYNIDTHYKRYIYPTCKGKTNKIKISAPYHSVIVHKDGSEYPYMINHYTRNNEMIHHKDFHRVYTKKVKDLDMIINHTGVIVKRVPIKICEGNGWYIKGFRYTYKDFYCEL